MGRVGARDDTPHRAIGGNISDDTNNKAHTIKKQMVRVQPGNCCDSNPTDLTRSSHRTHGRGPMRKSFWMRSSVVRLASGLAAKWLRKVGAQRGRTIGGRVEVPALVCDGTKFHDGPPGKL